MMKIISKIISEDESRQHVEQRLTEGVVNLTQGWCEKPMIGNMV